MTMPNSAACLIAFTVSHAGVGQTDDLGLRSLRLQQEGREVLRGERMLDVAQHLAARGLHDRGGFALERLPKA
jgi:hypothetical protein